MFKSHCDMCGQCYYHAEKNLNKRRNGFPVYVVCDYCYNWSVPKKCRDRYKKLGGSKFPPVTSGKKFSKAWNNVYRKGIKEKHDRKEEHDRNENHPTPPPPYESISSDEVDNEHERSKGVNINETMRNAVHVVESGVSGLIHGASEALSSLSPFHHS